jgi:hypothetical protein
MWVIKKSNLWRNGAPFLYAFLGAVLAATGLWAGSTIGQNAFGMGWLQKWVFVEGAEGGVLGIGAFKIFSIVVLGLILGTFILKGLRGFMGGKGWLAKPSFGNVFLGLSAVGVMFMFSIFGMAAKHRQIDLSGSAGVAGANIFKSTIIEAVLFGEDALKQTKTALISDELTPRNRMDQLQHGRNSDQDKWYNNKEPPSGDREQPAVDYEALYNQGKPAKKSGTPTQSKAAPANHSSQTKNLPQYREGNEPSGSFWEEQSTHDTKPDASLEKTAKKKTVKRRYTSPSKKGSDQ